MAINQQFASEPIPFSGPAFISITFAFFSFAFCCQLLADNAGDGDVMLLLLP